KDAPRTLADLKERYAGVTWGRDDVAMVMTRWFKTRHETRLLVDPGKPGTARLWIERNMQDQYKDPGMPVFKTGAFGRPVMQFAADGNSVLVAGLGAARDGDHPYLARMALDTGALDMVWRAEDPSHHEVVAGVLDEAGTLLLTNRQSTTEPPNYFVRKVGAGGDAPRQLTHFPDPMPGFAGVEKQTVAYKRADGVALSGTLYLPAGYEPKRDGPLPMLMWAYPTEFTDAAVAGQVVDRARNRFTRPQGMSHLFLVTQGYAVFDGPNMPIIGANGAEPNDTYIEQLTEDAKAAVEAVVGMGVADRERIAVGGHSYGAFMTANLLAHTDLFRAGIARSGAYNRTLTPFSFQAEQRTYWQATDTYTKMSPFTYVQKIKAPILLIHGGADDNSGTFPIQSERFYAALKGNGATVRYVVLPNEPHGYRGRESVLHTLWEMNQWMDRYVKHAKPRTQAAAPGGDATMAPATR
ncbi:MAG: family peptidase, partial [Rhodospirillales bacterium]|nr:family peptidase [Rhodospirillales bacterium]